MVTISERADPIRASKISHVSAVIPPCQTQLSLQLTQDPHQLNTLSTRRLPQTQLLLLQMPQSPD